MKKYLFTGFLVGILMLGSAPAFAQSVSDLQSQIQALLEQITSLQEQIDQQGEVIIIPPVIVPEDSYESSKQECLNLKKSLYLGLSDKETNGEVSQLQQFLQDLGLYTYPLITGYFGSVTEQNVQNFQSQYNIVSSGSPDTTGWGVVGNKTKKAIKDISCGEGSVSDNYSPFFTIISPNGGEQWAKGVDQTVTWNKSSVSSSKVTLSLINQTSGITYIIEKSKPNDSSESVKIDSLVPTGSYRLKIEGSVNGILVSDISDQPFTVSDSLPADGIFTASPTTVISGNGIVTQFSWPNASYFQLRFSCPAGITSPHATLAVDQCASAFVVNIASSNNNFTIDKFISTLTKPTKVQLTLSIFEAGNDYLPATQDDVKVKEKTLSITVVPVNASALNIISPNWGGIWEQGAKETITWSSVNISSGDKVSVYLQSVKGSQQYVVKTGISNDLKETITVPKVIPLGDYYLIVQANVNGEIVEDYSDNPITIVAPGDTPSVTVLYPNGGEKWEQGSTQTITWKTSGFSPTANVSVDVSALVALGYVDYLQVPSLNDGIEEITVPFAPSGSNYLASVAVWEGISQIRDESDSTITIFDKGTSGVLPTCTLTADKTSYNVGDSIKFSWKSKNATYATWQQDTSGKDTLTLPSDKLSASGSQLITASGTGNPSVTLLVYGADGSSGLCKTTVSITGPSLNILSPNGGGVYGDGVFANDKSFTVTWSSQGIVGSQKIDILAEEFSDGGLLTATHTLKLQTSNDGKETVKLPSTAPGGAYKIRINININGNIVTDVSDGLIPFTFSPFLQIVSPNGGEVLPKGKTIQLMWTSLNMSGSKIDFYLVNQITGAEYILAKGKDNDGSVGPTISTTVPDGAYKLKAEVNFNGAIITDMSDASFTVGNGSGFGFSNSNSQIAAVLNALQAITLQLQTLLAFEQY